MVGFPLLRLSYIFISTVTSTIIAVTSFIISVVIFICTCPTLCESS